MSYYDLGRGSDVRICYVHAWADEQWCKANGVPYVSAAERRSVAAKRGAIKRAETYRRRAALSREEATSE